MTQPTVYPPDEDDDGLPWYDPDDDLEYEDELDEALMECHMGEGGYCGAEGSEYCDWECPFNR